MAVAIELPEQFGRYRILKPLGKGGMGAVYLAEDTQLGRRVALKVPHFTADDGPAVIERFYLEARAAAGIEHPNLCAVYDVGEVGGIYLRAGRVMQRSVHRRVAGSPTIGGPVTFDAVGDGDRHWKDGRIRPSDPRATGPRAARLRAPLAARADPRPDARARRADR